MPDIKLKEIIDSHFGNQEYGYAEDYVLFRTIEDWCRDNLNRTRWRFDYSSTICVCGVDIPGRIIFGSNEDKLAFKLRFGSRLTNVA